MRVRARLKIIVSSVLSLVTGCTVDPGQEPRDKVTVIASLGGSPYQAEVRILALPDELRDLNHMAYSLQMGKDGYLYIGIGDNLDNGHLLRFDPASEKITDLGNFRDALADDIRSEGNYGKFHVRPHQADDGVIYFASHTRERWDGEQSGRLFSYSGAEGVKDLGATPNNQSVYFMYGDDRYGKLYLANRDSHFAVYDISTGVWQDKGRFTSKAPFIGLTDRIGRLYVYSHDGDGDWVPGPSTITRYDPASDSLLTSKNAPPSLWVGAVTPDHQTAYTTSYRRAEIFRWRFDEWPDFKTQSLGRIDPDGRPVFSNNLSHLASSNALVLAGTIESRDNWYLGSIHGLWLYEMGSRRKYMVAKLNEALSESFGIESARLRLYWTNANTVDRDGWIYIGIHTLPSDESSRARLLAIRVRPKHPG